MTAATASPPRRCAQPPRPSAIATAVLLFASALLLPGDARAQNETVAGVVVSVGTAEPIANAQVGVAGGTARALTDSEGRFRLTGVPAGQFTLEARRIGYAVARVPVRGGDQSIRIQLSPSATSLEAVVVTGTAGAAQRREIGNAVASIDAASLVENAPIVNMQALINGRAPGVVVMPTSGMVGTGQQVRIRGTSSLSLGNNPLIYVDGVRVNNEVGTGPISQGFGSRPISRLNDINPNDIASIEILKGPSAATLYGTEASNGVINIITKRGSEGAARWTANIRQGVNYLQDWRTRFPTNYGINASTGEIETLNVDSLVAGNQGEDVYVTGRHQETELSVNGGTERLNYYLSGGLLDSDGADPNNSTKRYSGRANLTIRPTSTLQLTTNVGYVNGVTNLACDAGCGGRTWTMLLGTPATYNNPRRHGFHSMLPYQYDEVYKLWQDVDRFTGSIQLEHTPISWLQHRLTLGYDRTTEGNNEWYPRVDSLVYTAGSDALGYREITDRTTDYRSMDYSASATANVGTAWRFTTSAGAQYYQNATDYVFAVGSVFPTPGLKTVAATTTDKSNDHDFFEDKTLGMYVQEQIGWRDRLFGTVALRMDDNSAFGAGFNRVYYPKYSLSWVLSEEPWFALPGVSQYLQSFRLRAAYGEAGKAPATYASLRTFESASGPGDSPAVTPQFIGNPDLGPERGKEYELGFDVGALDDRLGLEFTYYNKKTTDAILNRQIAPSIGFSGSQPFNAGSIRNSGVELALTATPIRGDRLVLDLGFNYATNDNEILSLYGDETFVNSGSFTRHTIGYPAFGFWERDVVAAELDPATGLPIASSVMCNPGNGGSPVLCAGTDLRYGTADDAPLVFLGRSIPPREGSLTGTLTLFNRVRVSSFFDFKSGHKKVDGNTRVRCTPIIGARCREWFYPLEYDPVKIAQVRNSNLVEHLIADASFTKWREFTVAYDIPDRFARMGNFDRATVSVSGRNLKTWTDYQGFEPEAMWLGGTRGGNVAWEQTTMPQLTSWILSFTLGF